MPTFHCQLIIPSSSSINADSVVNTWSFGGTDPSNAATAEAAVDLLFDLYAQGTPALFDYYAGYLDFAQAHVKVYDINDPEPRVPVADIPFASSPDALSGTNLPEETACCLSFQAAQQSGSPQARRRGRVFLGPLNTAAAGSNDDTPSRPNNTFLTLLAAEGASLISEGTNGLWWGVWSRVDNVIRRVENGWVDDAWDTQRRRGVEPTQRVTFGNV